MLSRVIFVPRSSGWTMCMYSEVAVIQLYKVLHQLSRQVSYSSEYFIVSVYLTCHLNLQFSTVHTIQ